MTRPIEPTVEADFSFAQETPFRLDAGGELQPVTLRYAQYGALNRSRDNVVLVCHALSGSARVADWWDELVGPGKPLDPDRYCILGINILGSCYGSSGPTSINPKTGRRYASAFPLVSIGDMVRSQAALLEHLGVEHLQAVVGGSIGGLQALDWAVRYPERVARCIAIGAAPLSAMGLAMSHLQRQAIRNDPAWRGGEYPDEQPPGAGLALARAIAMCTYKSAELFDERYGRKPDRSGEDPAAVLHARFDIGGYLDYQGQLLVRRFDANSYLIISKAMDTFDFARIAGSEDDALRRIRARVLLIGITSDWLFPAADVRGLTARLRTAGVATEYAEQKSQHGHDAFLAEPENLIPLLTGWL
jgi:homoserine O-acetyltransferase